MKFLEDNWLCILIAITICIYIIIDKTKSKDFHLKLKRRLTMNDNTIIIKKQDLKKLLKDLDENNIEYLELTLVHPEDEEDENKKWLHIEGFIDDVNGICFDSIYEEILPEEYD